eukprot:3117490-Prymnesium_polylepis.1
MSAGVWVETWRDTACRRRKLPKYVWSSVGRAVQETAHDGLIALEQLWTRFGGAFHCLEHEPFDAGHTRGAIGLNGIWHSSRK